MVAGFSFGEELAECNRQILNDTARECAGKRRCLLCSQRHCVGIDIVYHSHYSLEQNDVVLKYFCDIHAS